MTCDTVGITVPHGQSLVWAGMGCVLGAGGAGADSLFLLAQRGKTAHGGGYGSRSPPGRFHRWYSHQKIHNVIDEDSSTTCTGGWNGPSVLCLSPFLCRNVERPSAGKVISVATPTKSTNCRRSWGMETGTKTLDEVLTLDQHNSMMLTRRVNDASLASCVAYLLQDFYCLAYRGLI